MPSKSLFPQPCANSSGSMVGLMATSTKKAYATCFVTQVAVLDICCYPCSRPLLTCTSTGDTQTLKGSSGSVSVGSLCPGVHKVLFEPSDHLWWVCSMFLNVILLLLPSCWAYSLPLDMKYLGEGNGNPLQYSCLENPRDREACWAAVSGVTQSWT